MHRRSLRLRLILPVILKWFPRILCLRFRRSDCRVFNDQFMLMWTFLSAGAAGVSDVYCFYCSDESARPGVVDEPDVVESCA